MHSCDERTADNICNFNRHYAERAGYWERSTTFLKDESMTTGEITFYDSNTGAHTNLNHCLLKNLNTVFLSSGCVDTL